MKCHQKRNQGFSQNFLTSLVRYFDAVCNVDLNRLFLGRAYYPDAINEASKKLKHWIFFFCLF